MLLAFLFTDFFRSVYTSKQTQWDHYIRSINFLFQSVKTFLKKQDYYKTMVFAEGDIVKWSIVVLKQFLSERNVPVPAGNRKTDIVRKCLLAQELELPVLPNFMKKDTEIAERRLQKLTIDGIKLPFPEEIKGWMDA